MKNVVGAGERGHLHPGGKVVGAVDPAAVGRVTEALARAGFDAIGIEILTVADLESVSAPLDRAGFPGFLGRFFLSLGDDLDELERARRELAAGHVILAVPIAGEEAKSRVRDVLRDHGGHVIRYFGHWTVTALDEATRLITVSRSTAEVGQARPVPQHRRSPERDV